MRYTGVVQKGKKRGTELGFPTVNIEMAAAGGENPEGIFAATISFDGKEYPSAVYADAPRKILEAHLLDFSGDLYDKEIEIELLEKIRDDKTFSNEDELKAAIAADVAKVREFFKN